jgi:hypothetical protein
MDSARVAKCGISSHGMHVPVILPRAKADAGGNIGKAVGIRTRDWCKRTMKSAVERKWIYSWSHVT